MKVLFLQTTGDTLTNLPIPLDTTEYVSDSVFYLCCNFCEDSIVGTLKLPVLRQIKTNKYGKIEKLQPLIYWLKVTQRRLASIRLFITDENGQITSFDENPLSCTVLLKHKYEKCTSSA